jgi:hypothetical protein
VGDLRKKPPLTLLGLLVVVAFVGVVGFLVIAVPRAREDAHRAGGGSQIKTLYLALHMCAEEHGGMFPPLDAQAGRLMADRDSVYPRYLRDVRMLVASGDEGLVPYEELSDWQSPPSEKHRQCIDDHSYIYLGYALTSQSEGLAWVEAYCKQAEAGGGFDEDLPASAGAGSMGTNRFYRLQGDFLGFLEGEDIELGAKAVPDTQIPVFVERPGHYPHRPGGWVVFVDGHAEYCAYPGKFPMTKKFIEALESLDELEEGP